MLINSKNTGMCRFLCTLWVLSTTAVILISRNADTMDGNIRNVGVQISILNGPSNSV